MAKQMGPTVFELADGVKLSSVGNGNMSFPISSSFRKMFQGFMSQFILVESSSLHPKFIFRIASCLHFQQICDKFKSNGFVHQFTPEMETAMMKNMNIHAQELIGSFFMCT